ncbi:uncharacterized protein BXZ73DRAFT_55263, partial [Epithele typhae]|uniref:uncharacterized protein n=1 Tax=Epithele typhae TaxID=378194 RepID=UPI002007564B
RHVKLILRIPAKCMSDDESAYEDSVDPHDGKKTQHLIFPPQFNIVNASWMSEELRNLLHSIDYVARTGHRKGGSVPRKRALPTSGANEVDKEAPRGLPKSCYDPAWLRSLNDGEKDGLKMGDAPYDFSLYDEPNRQVGDYPWPYLGEDNDSDSKDSDSDGNNEEEDFTEGGGISLVVHADAN